MNLSCSHLGFFYNDTDIYRFNFLAISMILLILSIPTIVCNFLICIAILKKKDLLEPSFFIIANLALSDFLGGSLSFTSYGIVCLQLFTANDPCPVALYGTYVSYVLCLVTGLTVLFQTIDRYIATFHSFWYREKFTSGLVLKTNVMIWMLCVCWVIYYAVAKHEKVFFTSLVFAMIVLLVTNLFCYMKIFRRIKKIGQDIQGQKRDLCDGRNTIPDSKIVQVTLMIITSLLICYAPFTVVLVYVIVDIKRTTFLSITWYWAWCLTVVNSAINPLITCSQLSVIRKFIASILCRCNGRTNRVFVIRKTARA